MIYIIYLNCMSDIMILALTVLQTFFFFFFFFFFFQKVALLHKMPKSEKGDNTVKYLQNFAKG